MMGPCILLILFGFVFYDPVNGEAVLLNSKNFDQTIASNELVLINFFVNWCGYSKLLQPIFDDAADMIHAEYEKQPKKIVMAKVNCDEEEEIAKRFRVMKYPTIKMVSFGEPLKHEYRGQRSQMAIIEFVRQSLQDPIKRIEHADAIKDLDKQKRAIIAYFEHHDLPEYHIYRRVATGLKDDCDFHVGLGEPFKHMRPAGQPVVHFRPDLDLSHDDEDKFTGNLNAVDEFKIWAYNKCVPLVKEITFDNAEELTEEGLPFLILFHAPNDTQSVKDFKSIIKREVATERHNFLFLTANGRRFAHPLQHLGKKEHDLPVIAIDSFRHMYMLPEFKHMYEEGKIKQFVQDLYSGKLHHEFHNGPGSFDVSNKLKGTPHANGEENKAEHAEHAENGDNSGHAEIDPDASALPESSFKKLAPSKNRYTLVRNEL